MELGWDHKECTLNVGKCKIWVPEIWVLLHLPLHSHIFHVMYLLAISMMVDTPVSFLEL
jgi:hypothetical protein